MRVNTYTTEKYFISQFKIEMATNLEEIFNFGFWNWQCKNYEWKLILNKKIKDCNIVLFTLRKALNSETMHIRYWFNQNTFLRIKWCHRLVSWNAIMSVIHTDKLSDNSYNIKAKYTSFYIINRMRIMSLIIMHLLWCFQYCVYYNW